MSKPRENKNGAGNPRNAKTRKNANQAEHLHQLKMANHGLGQREVRRNLLRKEGKLREQFTFPEERDASE